MMPDRVADTVVDARRMVSEVATDSDIPWTRVEVLHR
jgi:hypothetical protein